MSEPERPRQGGFRRRWLLWLLLISLVWVLISRSVEVGQVARTLAQGDWRWIAVAALLQFGHYALYAWSFELAFQVVGVESQLRGLFPVTLASLFLGLVAITGGAPLYIDDAVRRGQSGARATSGSLLVLVADYATFALLVVPSLVYLGVRGVLYAYEIVGAGALLGFTVAFVAVLFLGEFKPSALRRLLGWTQARIAGLYARLRRCSPLQPEWADVTAGEFVEAGRDILLRPREALATVLATMAMHVVDLVTLWVVFLAFRQPPSPGVVLAGYAVGTLFWFVSITPQGVGLVEGVTALVLTSLGVPGSAALVISLAYRGVSFWLPMLAGVALWPRLRSFRD